MSQLVLMSALVMVSVSLRSLAIATKDGPESTARQIIVRITAPTVEIALTVPAAAGRAGRVLYAQFPFAMEALLL